jgi:hypothetical protein
MLVVIPMAGLSSRFAKAGYSVPKYMLLAGGESLFRHAVRSFESLFDQASFLFVHRDVQDTGAFVDRECESLGLGLSSRACLAGETRGQAETVAFGLRAKVVPDETEIIIFNIDTIRPSFQLPDSEILDGSDGYLEVFRGLGDTWSFVRPAEGADNRVAETAEKRRISDLCSTGIYHFRHAGDFLRAFDEEIAVGPTDTQEFYVAPLYNRLIQRGLDIRYKVIDQSEVIFSGVPAEYHAYCQSIDESS